MRNRCAELDRLQALTALLQEAPQRAADDGEHDVVHLASGARADLLDLVQVDPRPVEAPVGADFYVERRAADGLDPAARRVPETLDRLRRRVETLPRAAGAGLARAHEPEGKRQRAPDLAREELHAAGRRPRDPAPGRTRDVVGIGAHHHVERVAPRDPVCEAVVDLGDGREAVSLDALDDPQLPERLSAVELLRHDPPGQPLELPHVPRHRQRRVAHVVLQVEAGVVDPHRLPEARNPGELLAKSRHLVQLVRRELHDALEVELSTGERQRLGVEERDRPDVHVRIVVLDGQERRVDGRKTLVVAIRHDSSPR